MQLHVFPLLARLAMKTDDSSPSMSPMVTHRSAHVTIVLKKKSSSERSRRAWLCAAPGPLTRGPRGVIGCPRQRPDRGHLAVYGGRGHRGRQP